MWIELLANYYTTTLPHEDIFILCCSIELKNCRLMPVESVVQLMKKKWLNKRYKNWWIWHPEYMEYNCERWMRRMVNKICNIHLKSEELHFFLYQFFVTSFHFNYVILLYYSFHLLLLFIILFSPFLFLLFRMKLSFVSRLQLERTEWVRDYLIAQFNQDCELWIWSKL